MSGGSRRGRYVPHGGDACAGAASRQGLGNLVLKIASVSSDSLLFIRKLVVAESPNVWFVVQQSAVGLVPLGPSPWLGPPPRPKADAPYSLSRYCDTTRGVDRDKVVF